MNIIGRPVTVMGASDPTAKGRSGDVVLETARTLQLRNDGKFFTIQKKGTVLMLVDSKETVSGDGILGRLEDRLRAKKK